MPRVRKKIGVIAGVMFVIVVAAIVVPQLLVCSNHQYSYTSQDELQQKLGDQPTTVIVFGGGIRDNQPRPVLKQRLRAAQSLYERGTINEIIVSGDTSSPQYDESGVMFRYLVDKGIPSEVIVKDGAGFSTYESCERARKVYNVNKVIAVTQVGHLDRAIYLCRSFGIETYGYAAERAGNRIRTSQVVRELLGNVKAVFNVYVAGEQTFLGDARENNRTL
jgi:vancomycin permeability regulator SanA